MRGEKHVLRTQSLPILSNELIVETLSWLPVKSLLRFRCVCKSWKSLISDPRFVKLHLQRALAKNSNLAHLRLLYGWVYKDFNQYVLSCSLSSLVENPSSVMAEQHFLNDQCWVMGSCNGLICLLGVQFENRLKDFWFRIWNPATRSISEKFPFICPDRQVYKLGFTHFGFGYDNLSDTYKVVAVLFNPNAKTNSQRNSVKVYNIGDNSWRNIQSSPALFERRRENGVYVSGTLNWIADTNNLSSDNYIDWNVNTLFWMNLVIISLDLGKETYTQISLPHGVDYKVTLFDPAILCVLRDCLCVYDFNKTHFVIWQMKEFGVENSWTQLLNISYEYLQPGLLVFQPSLLVLPLCMSENGDVLMLFQNGVEQAKAILYNRRDNRSEHFVIQIQIPKLSSSNIGVYVESLVFP